jgi:hypothetical protein
VLGRVRDGANLRGVIVNVRKTSAQVLGQRDMWPSKGVHPRGDDTIKGVVQLHEEIRCGQAHQVVLRSDVEQCFQC